MLRIILFSTLLLLHCISASAINIEDRYTFDELNKLTLYNAGTEEGYFGFAVAIEGDTGVVGAYLDNTEATAAGRVYVFRRTGSGKFLLSQELSAPDGAENDLFGYSIALSGEYLLVSSYKDDDPATDCGSVHVFKDNGTGQFEHVQKLLAADGATYDYFGKSVAIDGDTAVVGAYFDDDGDAESGSAYVFTRNDEGSFSQTAKLTANDAATEDYFGFSVAISDDTVAVGAYGDDDSGSGSGSAYIFTREESGSFSQTSKLIASDGAAGDWFGYSLAIDGDTVLVGAYRDDDNGSGSGSAYVFKNSSGTFIEQQKLTGSDSSTEDYFGKSVALSGDTAIIGAYRYNGYGRGGAYVFVAGEDGTFSEQSAMIADDGSTDDFLGRSVAVDGDTFFAGAYKEGLENIGAAYVYTKTETNTYSQSQKLTPGELESGDSLGTSLAIEGDIAVLGAPGHGDAPDNTGAAYLFSRQSNNTFTFTQKLVADDGAEDDNFATSVAISGSVILVGAPTTDTNGSNSGSVYVYRDSGDGTFIQTQKLSPVSPNAGDQFGVRIALQDETAIIGTPLNDDIGSHAGIVYVFEMDDTNTFSQTQMLAPDSSASDQFFGNSVSLSGNTLVVGAYSDNGNGASAGAAYVFTKEAGVFTFSQKLSPSEPEAYQRFGKIVAIQGNTLAVIASGGSDSSNSVNIPANAYLFQRDASGSFLQVARLSSDTPTASDGFGASACVGANYVVVGATKDEDVASFAGAAYIFAEDANGEYVKIAKITGSEIGSGDVFGAGIAIDGTKLLIGSAADDDVGSAYSYDVSYLADQEILKNAVMALQVLSGSALSEEAFLLDVDGNGQVGTAEAISFLRGLE